VQVFAGQKHRRQGEKFPLVMTSGRLVGTKAAAKETRSNLGWRSCSKRCSLNPRWRLKKGTATVNGLRPRQLALDLNVQAMAQQWPDTVFMPFHFCRW
jgi:hypothetical protein